jgi:hypothetical protein
MTVPGHLKQFIEFNTAGRVAMLCRSLGIADPGRIAAYTRAVTAAVYAGGCGEDCSVTQVDDQINTQLRLLQVALQRVPAPKLPKRKPQRDTAPVDNDEAPSKAEQPKIRPSADPNVVIGKSMEQKLEDSRKPLRKILQEDCVRLGLLSQERAERLASRLAGRRREDAEAELMAELRNNLHRQIRAYMRQNNGGPWTSPKQQEDVRLDIANTNSIHGVVTLTRHLLQERKNWEGNFKKGLLSSLLGGRFRFSNRNES